MGDPPGGEGRSLEVNEDVRTECADTPASTDNPSEPRSSGCLSELEFPAGEDREGSEPVEGSGLDLEAGREARPPAKKEDSGKAPPPGKPTRVEKQHPEQRKECEPQ